MNNQGNDSEYTTFYEINRLFLCFASRRAAPFWACPQPQKGGWGRAIRGVSPSPQTGRMLIRPYYPSRNEKSPRPKGARGGRGETKLYLETAPSRTKTPLLASSSVPNHNVLSESGIALNGLKPAAYAAFTF